MIIPNSLLKGKKVLLGVTGSISVYKALEVLRLLVKAGADVKVVMTPSALKFVTEMSFETLSRNKVLLDGNESWADGNNHINAAQEADLFLIAPCSANTIGKLSNALGDNVLLQCALAHQGKKLLAPAANTAMLSNPLTQGALKMLNVAGYEIIASQVKELACESVGDGALAEPEEIFWQAARALLANEYWSDRRVVVTGGGTVERIDDVRFISNFSSGKMASAIACALYVRGADVNLIATKKESSLPLSIHTIDVESHSEMLEYTAASLDVAKRGLVKKPTLLHDHSPEVIKKEPYLFMAAAVSDYAPEHAQQGKLKKEQLGMSFTLTLKQNGDILKTLNKEGVKSVAFKAELDAEHALENAKKLLHEKAVDAVALNIINDANNFGSDTNALTLLNRDAEVILPKNDKLTLALQLLDSLET